MAGIFPEITVGKSMGSAVRGGRLCRYLASDTLFVTDAVPLVSRLIAVVEVPPDGSAFNFVFLSWR